jgi:hypothetical protein
MVYKDWEIFVELEVEAYQRELKRARDFGIETPKTQRRNRLKPYSRNSRHVINELLDGLAEHYDEDIESILITE